MPAQAERRTVDRTAASSVETPLTIVLTERPELFSPGERRDQLYTDRLHHAIEVARDTKRDVVCVVDFGDEQQACEAVTKLHDTCPDAAFIVLYESDEPTFPEYIVVSTVRWSDLLRFDLHEEIERVQARERVRRLREFAEPAEVLPILLHADPDPDALASAFAVRVILRRTPEQAPIITPAMMTRPENRRMAELLKIRVTEVAEHEMQAFDRIVCVDVQPGQLNVQAAEHIAVIDHHPLDQGYFAELLDVRPDHGAAATLLTEYLRADDERRIHEPLATALLYAIKTDTAALTRGIAPDDVAAYAFLQQHADLSLLRSIEQPSSPEKVLRKWGQALAHMKVDDGLATADLGMLDRDFAHIMADLADHLLAIEDVVWSVVAARIDDQHVYTIRHIGEEPGAGALARRLAGKSGSGGGHATMARVALPVKDGEKDREPSAEKLFAWIHRELEKLRP